MEEHILYCMSLATLDYLHFMNVFLFSFPVHFTTLQLHIFTHLLYLHVQLVATVSQSDEVSNEWARQKTLTVF